MKETDNKFYILEAWIVIMKLHKKYFLNNKRKFSKEYLKIFKVVAVRFYSFCSKKNMNW